MRSCFNSCVADQNDDNRLGSSAGCSIKVDRDEQAVRFRLPRPGGAIPIGLITLMLAGFILFQTVVHYEPYLRGGSPAGDQHPLVTLLGCFISLLLAGYGVQHLLGRIALIVTADEVIRSETGPLGRRVVISRSQILELSLDLPPGQRRASRLSLTARLRDGGATALLTAARADEATWLADRLATELNRPIIGRMEA